MIKRIKLIVLLMGITCIALIGCATSQALSTGETRLLSPTPILTIPLTPTPVCTDEPDKLLPSDHSATIEQLDSLTEYNGYSDLFFRRVEDGLEFNIQGIYAINADIAFIFGGLSNLPGTNIRSLILRSEDGGKHWKEVMAPISSNEITHVVFIGDGEGWAISTWTVEGLLGTRLWHTTDYGETWQESKGSSPFPLANPPVDSIDGIRIFDNKHMQVKSLYYWANPYADRYMILDSYDGGINWNESFSISVDSTNLNVVSEAYADTPGGHYGNYYSCSMSDNTCISYGQDGSKWRVQYIYSKKCSCCGGTFNQEQYAEVQRTWSGKDTSYTIPLYFYDLRNRNK